jgi:predicted nucleic acid-binding protein
MRILIDTIIIVDALTGRAPFYKDSQRVITESIDHDVEAYVTANTITDIYYLLKKYLSNENRIRTTMLGLMDLLAILPVSANECYDAFDTGIADFEDSLLAVCAEKNALDRIVTRNAKDFRNSPVPVVSPQEYLAELAS